MRRFDIGDDILVVCRSEQTGEVFALDARCPHEGALLCKGELGGLAAPVGAGKELIRRGEILLCPLHQWQFDVRTGSSIHVWPAVHADTFPTRVEDGAIYVSYP
jgi:3-phenylpropionate/trans-cinnamate dioxygenase ferredoxin subunit